MALKTYRPTSPSMRQLVLVDRSSLWKGSPVKMLVEGKHKTGGRNVHGRITTRHIGGGHKQSYRMVDFKRRKFDMPGVVERLDHDKSIDSGQYGYAMGEVAQDFVDFDVWPVSPEIEVLAIAAMTHSRLRAMDALHIGTAQAARVDLFVTADRKQALAAQAAGLKTELVEA